MSRTPPALDTSSTVFGYDQFEPVAVYFDVVGNDPQNTHVVGHVPFLFGQKVHRLFFSVFYAFIVSSLSYTINTMCCRGRCQHMFVVNCTRYLHHVGTGRKENINLFYPNSVQTDLYK